MMGNKGCIFYIYVDNKRMDQFTTINLYDETNYITAVYTNRRTANILDIIPEAILN
jgi:hypothetical protein